MTVTGTRVLPSLAVIMKPNSATRVLNTQPSSRITNFRDMPARKHNNGLAMALHNTVQTVWKQPLQYEQHIQGDQKVSVHLMITVQKNAKIF
jgi:hypothetical protein